MQTRSQDGIWTIGQLILWTTQFFREKQIDSPRLDAEVLLAHVLQCSRIDLYTDFDQPVAETDRSAFRNSVRLRAQGQPIAYLVGKREFYSLDFTVDPTVLIPRPETETLVSEVLRRIPTDRSVRILDVGTGSGAIAIAIAAHAPNAQLLAVDISQDALDVARKNAEQHGVLDRIQFRISNLLQDVSDSPPFDLIVSNPPYIRTTEMSELPRDVRDFEPKLALAAGHDGLDCLRPIIESAHRLLLPRAWLLVEFGIDHETPLRKIANSIQQYDTIETIFDDAKRPRVLCVQTQE